MGLPTEMTADCTNLVSGLVCLLHFALNSSQSFRCEVLEDYNTEKTLENLRARNRSDNENSREPELSWMDPQVNDYS